MTAADDALARLVAVLDRFDTLAIAVSGGVDSMTLAHVAWRHGRVRMSPWHAAGPAVPASASARVARHAAREGWPLMVLDAGEQRDLRYRENPVDRCYWCKTNLYDRLREATADPIASGTNTDDLDDFRPGLRAAGERGIVHPFVEAGIDKATVYAIASRLGLDDLEALPAQPCLASRVETGIAIDPVDLAFVDEVERALAAYFGAGATLRCRITRDGVVVELADGLGEDATAAARDIAAARCAQRGRQFAGVRPYRRGAAFLRVVAQP